MPNDGSITDGMYLRLLIFSCVTFTLTISEVTVNDWPVQMVMVKLLNMKTKSSQQT